LQVAMLRPKQSLHMWAVLCAILLTVAVAAYVGFRHEEQRRRVLPPPIEAIDAALKENVLLLCIWLATRLGAVLGTVLSWAVGRQLGKRLQQRVGAAIAAAASAAMESVSFWFDVLWLNRCWTNADVRYRPYAILITVAYAIGCSAYMALSLRLIFPSLRKDGRWLLDQAVLRSNTPLWSVVVLASWGASPALLTLLPWQSRSFDGLPTYAAMESTFIVKSIFQGTLMTMKLVLLTHLNAEDFILLTLLLNLIAFVRALLQRALTWLALRAIKTRWTRIAVFLSYRVNTDQELVQNLYDRMIKLGLRVWYDKVSLKPGQVWEEGFANGLFDAKVFVPVLSKGGLSNFASLKADSTCDNVLLEQLLALEQHKRKRISAIFPVFVGEQHASSGRFSNFFQTKGLPLCKDDVTVEEVDEKAREHLGRQHGANEATLLVEDRTPAGVLQHLKKFHGAFVQGDGSEALDRIAETVCDIMKDVAAGRISVEAKEGEGSAKAEPDDGCAADEAAPRCASLSWWRGLPRMSRKELLLAPGRASAASSPGSRVDPASIEMFFSTGMRDGEPSAEETLSPVMVLKAKRDREKRKRPKPGSSQHSGVLRKLLPHEQVVIPVDKQVEEYLRRNGVEDSPNMSLRDDSHHALELQRHQVSLVMQERSEVAQRSRLRRARHYLETGRPSGGVASESGPEGSPQFGSLFSALKHAARSVKERPMRGKAHGPVNLHRAPDPAGAARVRL